MRDLRNQSTYQRATKDYSPSLGDRELYRRYFREAFEDGYNTERSGWDTNSRDKNGDREDRELEWPWSPQRWLWQLRRLVSVASNCSERGLQRRNQTRSHRSFQPQQQGLSRSQYLPESYTGLQCWPREIAKCTSGTSVRLTNTVTPTGTAAN